MAKIKGFQLKNIKRTMGKEGYGCVASMYLNGKKIGSYRDYGDGACEDVTYVSRDAEKEMTRLIIAYAKDHPNMVVMNFYKKNPDKYRKECERFKKLHPYIPEEDITVQTMAANSITYIVTDYIDLFDIENKYKEYVKKGFIAVSCDGKHLYAYPESYSEERIRQEAEGHKLYLSLDDFNIA